MNLIAYFILYFALALIWSAKLAAAPFFFATLGDTQNHSEQGQAHLDAFIKRINQRQPAFAVHIGELKGGVDNCHDRYYQRVLHTLNQFKQPLIYVPGDNDWTDCFHSGFDPLERLSYLRKQFYPEPLSLGQTTMAITRQSSQPEFSQFPENVWWQQGEVLFATFHNVGTNNNLYSHAEAVTEHLSRNNANLAWLNHIFAKASSAKALVLFTHANIKFDAVAWEPTGFDLFRAALAEHVRQFARPVLLVHGDTHQHKVDKPLKYQGQTLNNFTRLEVFGSPDLGVVYVHVHPETESVFRFEPLAIGQTK